MILRKLSIYGFKSFADKTDLKFGSGMTAVIGPNGCGKSNVVDAIRWVFGEQKASMLRSSSMQDVIFSGTQRRQPLNMAEVTLTVENNQGILPVEYSEVSITRRIYRSGESEYRLNKVPCRLRDIHNLFLDTGVGSTAYTTIENSMINAILSDKAEERRLLFEEAAGIGKYKKRRKESVRQLDRTRQDLLRINDKVQEADRQVRMLARHVEKAKRYKAYYDDLKSLEVGFENSRYQSLAQSLKQRKAFLAENEMLRETLRARIGAAESRIEKMSLVALEKEKELERASKSVSECNELIINLDRSISVNQERMSNLRRNIQIYDQDVLSLDKQIEESALLKTQIEKSIVERETQLLKSKERVEGANDELADFDSRLLVKRESADQLGRDQIELINTHSEARNRLSGAKSDLSNALERRDRDEREIHNLENRLEEYQELIEACKKQLSEVDHANRNHLQVREVLSGRIEKEDQRYNSLVESEKHLEAHIASCKSQLKFLAGLDASFEGYESGVKAILNLKPKGLRGIVADLIKVDDEKVIAVAEKVMGNRIQTVVFDTDEDLQQAVEYLKEQKVGAACMVSLERLTTAVRPCEFDHTAGLVSIRRSIKTADNDAVVADHFFNNVYMTADYKDALCYAKEFKSPAVVVTGDGVICSSDATVVAGDAKEENAGILQRKQQIEKLSGDIITFEKEYNQVLTEKDSCIINRDEAKMNLVEVDEKINHGHRKQQEQQTNISHYENEIQSVVSRTLVLKPELMELNRKITNLEEVISNAEAEEATFQSRRETLEELVDEARAAVRAMEEQRRRLVEHLKNIELEVHGLQNRITQDRRDIERLTKDIRLFGERKNAKIEEKGKAQSEIGDLENNLVSQKQELGNHTQKRRDLEQVRDTVREGYNASLSEIDESRNELRTDQSELEVVSNKVHDGEIKQTRDEEQQRRIREKIWEAYELDLESPPEGIAVIEEEDSSVVQNISMLKERIRHVGQVNMAALEDFEVESKRLNELTQQRDDLQVAVDDLEKAIKKLDKEARNQFLATFDLVQKNFTEMFTTLFEGGEANIELQPDVDPLEAAIHINVRPAGKKMRGVQLLSGGERALTAISLLFALYLVKPSAYCILDELDAPLDDANTGRFIKVLRKFAEKTQFIVITHNKRTMEAADLLYGVTQQDKGVSTIVSVKFDEAELQAA